MNLSGYDKIKRLSNNLIAVRHGYKWGLVNNQSQILMRIVYDYIDDNAGELWAMYNGHKFPILMDKLPMRYDYIYDFNSLTDQVAWARVEFNDKIGIINQNFEEIVPCEFDEIFNFEQSVWYGKKEGTEASVFAYSEGNMIEYKSAGEMIGQWYIVIKQSNDKLLYGIIDNDAKIVIKCENKYIKNINIGKFYSSVFDLERFNGFHYYFSLINGLIDIGYLDIYVVNIGQKEFIVGERCAIYPHFDDCFSHEHWVTDSNDIYVDVYKEDNFVLSYNSAECTLVSNIENDLFVYKSVNEPKYGIIRKDGYLTSSIYDEITYNSRLCIIIAIRESILAEVDYPYSNNKRIGGIVDIYNLKGEIIKQSISYEELDINHSYYYAGYLRLCIAGLTSVYKDWRLIIPSNIYDEIESFIQHFGSNYIDVGYALVKKWNKWGVINSDGCLKVPIIYDSIKTIRNTRCMIKSSYYEKNMFLLAQNSNDIHFYLADISLRRLNYSYIGSNDRDNLFLVSNDSIPLDLIENKKLLFFIKANNSQNYLFGKIDMTGQEVLPCSYSFEKILEYETNRDMERNMYKEEYNSSCLNCKIVKYSKTGKVGLIDNENHPLCDFMYDAISEFDENGIAITLINKKNGLINQYGKTILPCEYAFYCDNNIQNSTIYGVRFCRPCFTEGYMIIMREGRFGLVDKTGTIVVPCLYPGFKGFGWCIQIDMLKKGYVIVQSNEKNGLVSITKPNDYFLDCIYDNIKTYTKMDYAHLCGYSYSINIDYLAAFSDNKWNIIDFNSGENVLTISDIQVKDICIISENCIIAQVFHDNCLFYRIYSLFDSSYQKDYSNIIFKDGLYVRVCNYAKWGLLDVLNGQEIIPCMYTEIVDICRKNENYGKEDEFLLFDYAIIKENGKKGFINGENQLIGNRYFDEVQTCYSSGVMAAVLYETKWGFIDKKGIIIAHGFDEVDVFLGEYARVKKDGKWGYITKDGNLIASGFDEVGIRFGEYARVKKDGKWGFIKKNGDLIASGFDEALDFHNGCARVKQDSKWAYINAQGRLIADGFEDQQEFSDGYAAVKRNGKWGYIDKSGSVVIPFRFTKANPFSDGLAAVAFKNSFGYIDKHNKTIIPFRFKSAEPFEKGLARVADYEGGHGYLSKNGLEVDWIEPTLKYDDEDDYARDTWDALTDGQYGDMPDDFYGDYDGFGF